MSTEMWTIIGVGFALAWLTISGHRGLKSEICALAMRVKAIEDGQAGLRERMAHLDGLLEGLREAITRHRAA